MHFLFGDVDLNTARHIVIQRHFIYGWDITMLLNR